MSSEIPAPQRVSPRRRFHRPAAEFLGARCQVPVLMGLPRVEVAGKQTQLGITETTKSDAGTNEFDAPIAGAVGPDENQAEKQQPLAPAQIAPDTTDTTATKKANVVSTNTTAATSGQSREWIYPLAGTLIAVLLVFAAVFGLKPQIRELWGSQEPGWQEATPNDDSASVPMVQRARALSQSDETEPLLAEQTSVAPESAQGMRERTPHPLGELARQPLERQVGPETAESLQQSERQSTAFELSVETTPAETQTPSVATEFAESSANEPAFSSSVMASAPSHVGPTGAAPTPDMPADEQFPNYPTTSYSEELPPLQAIPGLQAIFADGPVLAPPLPEIQRAATPEHTPAPPSSPMNIQAQSFTHGQQSVPGNRQVQMLGQRHLGPVYDQPRMPSYTPFTPGIHGPGRQSIEQARLNGNIEPHPAMNR